MKTSNLRKEDVTSQGTHAPKWLILDAADQTLGRVASQVATLLRGKHKPTFSPHLNGGDFVIVLNAQQIKLSGKKEKNKMYYRHTGFPGGIKATVAERMRKEKPTEMLRLAIKRMLPKNILGREILNKLKVYPEGTHPHEAQMPTPYLLPYN